MKEVRNRGKKEAMEEERVGGRGGEERRDLADCCISSLTEGHMMRISCVTRRGGAAGICPGSTLFRVLQSSLLHASLQIKHG